MKGGKRQRSRKSSEKGKYKLCKFLDKYFTHDEMLTLAETVVGSEIDPDTSFDELCGIVETECPECAGFLKYILKNYKVNTVFTVFLVLFGAYAYPNVILPAMYSSATNFPAAALKTSAFSGVFNAWVPALLAPISLTVPMYDFSKMLYDLYKKKVVINKLGKVSKTVNDNQKMDIVVVNNDEQCSTEIE